MLSEPSASRRIDMTGQAVSPPGVAPSVATVIQFLAERFNDRRPVSELTPSLARERLRRIWVDFWSAGGPPIARQADFDLDTSAGKVTVRLYDPNSDGTRPVLFIHGGGFVIGDLDTHDCVARRLALYGGRPVVSIHYRLAPEFPYPAPLDDCVAVARAVAAGASGLGIDGSSFALVGDSAGANLALGTALRLRDSGGPTPKAVALIFGCYDPAMTGETVGIYGDGRYLLSSADMRWYWRQYLGDAMSAPPIYAAPLAADLAGLPPLFVTAAECDPLRDDSATLVKQLAAAGVPHQFRVWPGMVHGCVGMSRLLNQADNFLAEIAVWLASRLE
jgi:acetyl esterase